MKPYNSPLWNFFKLKEGIDIDYIVFQLEYSFLSFLTYCILR